MVEIGEGGARAPLREIDPGGGGDVGERAVAVVVEEDGGAEVGEVEIGEPVGVIVANRDPLAVVVVADAGRGRHVAKARRAPAAVEAVAVLAIPFLRLLQTAALGEVEVEPAVEIDIEPGGAPSHHLDDQPVFCLLVVEVGEVDARIAGNIDKSGGRGGRRPRGRHARLPRPVARAGNRPCLRFLRRSARRRRRRTGAAAHWRDEEERGEAGHGQATGIGCA